jgi:glycerol-3-phosphate acyltransferase PlsY
VLSAILFCIATFVIAGIPTGYWTVKVLKGIDIRELGSKSTGATNVWRCVGPGPGLFVFFADLFKGYIPTALAHYLSNGALAADWSFAPNVVPAVVALAALVGHSKSVFLNFQGGKSAATGLGTLLGLCPPGGALTFLTWCILVALFRYVSLGSVLGVLMCGVYFKMFNAPTPYVVYCVLGFLWVTWRHKANMLRLFKGTEPKVGDKPKETADQKLGAAARGAVAPNSQDNPQATAEPRQQPLPQGTTEPKQKPLPPGT